MILPHWSRLEITAINNRFKFKFKGIEKFASHSYLKISLIAIEFLEFVYSQLRIATESVSLFSRVRWHRKEKRIRGSDFVGLRIVYHWFKDNTSPFRDLIGENKQISTIFNLYTHNHATFTWRYTRDPITDDSVNIRPPRLIDPSEMTWRITEFKG